MLFDESFNELFYEMLPIYLFCKYYFSPNFVCFHVYAAIFFSYKRSNLWGLQNGDLMLN